MLNFASALKVYFLNGFFFSFSILVAFIVFLFVFFSMEHTNTIKFNFNESNCIYGTYWYHQHAHFPCKLLPVLSMFDRTVNIINVGYNRQSYLCLIRQWKPWPSADGGFFFLQLPSRLLSLTTVECVCFRRLFASIAISCRCFGILPSLLHAHGFHFDFQDNASKCCCNMQWWYCYYCVYFHLIMKKCILYFLIRKEYWHLWRPVYICSSLCIFNGKSINMFISSNYFPSSIRVKGK